MSKAVMVMSKMYILKITEQEHKTILNCIGAKITSLMMGNFLEDYKQARVAEIEEVEKNLESQVKRQDELTLATTGRN
jgi:hypothetical protein